MAFLTNTWYVAAWNSDIKNGELFSRTLLNEKIVFFRNKNKEIQAISDRCPHRFAPLSMGTHCGNTVQCAYHGLEFDGTGTCTKNPHGDGKIPKAAKVKAYITAEKYNLIWLWFGDNNKADEALIPDFSCMNPELFYVAKGYLHAKANYVLETDNILDLSHIQFLHPSTLGGDSDSVSQAITSLEQQGDTIWSYRQTVNETMPDFLYNAMGIEHGIPVDRWIDVRWNAPASMLLFAGATPTGRPRSEGNETLLPHIFTPETDKTTHYFYSFPMPLAMGEAGAAIAEQQLAGLSIPFTNEDLPMLEAQQSMIGDEDFWSLKPILLISDAPGVRARRLLDKMISDQQIAAV